MTVLDPAQTFAMSANALVCVGAQQVSAGRGATDVAMQQARPNRQTAINRINITDIPLVNGRAGH
jgi:hypothetical protein